MGQAVVLALASLVSYWLTTGLLGQIHSVSRDDNLLGGMWAVIATAFVYRGTHEENMAAAVLRVSATLVSVVLCLIYLLFFPFHPWGLALLIALGGVVVTLLGRPQDVMITSVTTAVILVVAGISPRDAWQQPILRLVDTVIGVAVGLGACWLVVCGNWTVILFRRRRAESRPLSRAVGDSRSKSGDQA